VIAEDISVPFLSIALTIFVLVNANFTDVKAVVLPMSVILTSGIVDVV